MGSVSMFWKGMNVEQLLHLVLQGFRREPAGGHRRGHRHADAAEQTRRSGRASAQPPSMREKLEPHRSSSATGTTGTGSRSMMRAMPPRKGCSRPSRVMPPSGKMPSRSPSASTFEAASKARW